MPEKTLIDLLNHKSIEISKSALNVAGNRLQTKYIPAIISNLENIKYIFSGKDKLARFNPDNVLLKNVDHEKDIIHLEDVGHFPYFEDKELISKTLVKLIKS